MLSRTYLLTDELLLEAVVALGANKAEEEFVRFNL